MHTLSFTLPLEGVVRIHDAVLCLAKFSEVVSLEAHKDKVRDYLLPRGLQLTEHFSWSLPP